MTGNERAMSTQRILLAKQFSSVATVDTAIKLGSRVVSVLDSGAEGFGFKSQSRRCRVTILGKLFTPIVPLFTMLQNCIAALLWVAGVTAGLVESNVRQPTAGYMTHITCRLTSNNRDQLRNPTLGNRVSATFRFKYKI